MPYRRGEKPYYIEQFAEEGIGYNRFLGERKSVFVRKRSAPPTMNYVTMFDPYEKGKRRRRARRRRAALYTAVAVPALLLLFARLSLRKEPPPIPPPPPLPLAYPYQASPNCDDRPPDMEVTCVVLHATVLTTVEDTVKVFLDPAKKVSAHFVVGKEGEVAQMVPAEKRAWHAGISEWEGIPHLNDYSIGIEMVNRNDGRDPYPEAQYQAVAGILRFLRSRYAISDAHLLSHAQVALPLGRKSDPRGFDFEKIRALARP